MAALVAASALIAACAGAPPRRAETPAAAAKAPSAADGAAVADRVAANGAASLMRNWASSHGDYFRRTWGVDVGGVRLVADDWMLEFKFQVVDPGKAKPLLDVNARPFLVDERSGAVLAVPALENVGELRQHTSPKPGRTYFMIFGNAAKIVARGNPVSIVIGKFDAAGLPAQ